MDKQNKPRKDPDFERAPMRLLLEYKEGYLMPDSGCISDFIFALAGSANENPNAPQWPKIGVLYEPPPPEKFKKGKPAKRVKTEPIPPDMKNEKPSKKKKP
jgi:hypothetical protein